MNFITSVGRTMYKLTVRISLSSWITLNLREREREREREYDIQMIGVDKYMILLAHAWLQSVERRLKY